MHYEYLVRRIASAALTAAALLCPLAAVAQAPAPPPPPLPVMPPSLPPTHVSDLMTAAGSAAFGAQWRVMDVKIVEVPAIPNAMPQYKTTYNIEPRAGAADFDDSKWPVI